MTTLAQASPVPLWGTGGAQAASGSGFTLSRGFLVSLALHALLVSPFLLARYWVPEPDAQEVLAIELFGMIAQRQTEAQVQGAKQEVSATESKPLPPVQRPKEVKPTQLSKAESPVKVEQEEKQEVPSPVQPQMTAGADSPQQQQMLRPNNAELDALRKYTGMLKKEVLSRQAYPPEARKQGQIGTPIITFRLTATGEIEPGSLKIRRSSGFPLLDEEAMRAARASAPFPPPPRAMTIALDVGFYGD